MLRLPKNSLFILIIGLICTIGVAYPQGKGKGKGKGRDTETTEQEAAKPVSINSTDGFLTSIVAISGDRITFLDPASDSSSSSSGKGKGKGKGRFRRMSSSDDAEKLTRQLADTVLITTATRERRTGNLQVDENRSMFAWF